MALDLSFLSDNVSMPLSFTPQAGAGQVQALNMALTNPAGLAAMAGAKGLVPPAASGGNTLGKALAGIKAPSAPPGPKYSGGISGAQQAKQGGQTSTNSAAVIQNALTQLLSQNTGGSIAQKIGIQGA